MYGYDCRQDVSTLHLYLRVNNPQLLRYHLNVNNLLRRARIFYGANFVSTKSAMLTNYMKKKQLLLAKTTFQGAFYFTRFVTNPKIIMTGSAVFSTTCRDVSYKENGFYTLNGKKQTCYQHQTFLFTQDSIIIINSKGETLHTFNIADDNTDLKDTHICKHDRYAIDINIQSNNDFTISYRVNGPKKKYNITTRYRRLKKDHVINLLLLTEN